MKTDRLSIRVTEEEKKEIVLEADKYSMSTSEYVVSAVHEKMQVDKISDSQSKFFKTILMLLFKKHSTHISKEL